MIHPAFLLVLVAGVQAILNTTQYLNLVELDLDNQLTESEYIYGVGRSKRRGYPSVQVMRGRFGSPPWLRGGEGGNLTLSRQGRKLGAAKVCSESLWSLSELYREPDCGPELWSLTSSQRPLTTASGRPCSTSSPTSAL